MVDLEVFTCCTSMRKIEANSWITTSLFNFVLFLVPIFSFDPPPHQVVVPFEHFTSMFYFGLAAGDCRFHPGLHGIYSHPLGPEPGSILLDVVFSKSCMADYAGIVKRMR